MKIRIILLIVCLCVIGFIWGNSLLSAELSSQISQAVGELLADFLGEGDATQTVGGLSIRKLAHFVEFFALGAVIISLLTISVKGLYKRYSIATFLGLLVPVVDETIQIFSGRGSSLRDVWIDVGGYALGCSVACVTFFLLEKLKRRGKNHNKK